MGNDIERENQMVKTEYLLQGVLLNLESSTLQGGREVGTWVLAYISQLT